MGKVVVVGGCEEYTGAPYFAAYAALKMGADLAHVFCTRGAAPVIKGYSPELIVHPYLDEQYSASAVIEKFEPWMDKFRKDGTCVIIGPGLGRHPNVLEQAREILLAFNAREVPVVLDADALWMLSEDPGIVNKLELGHVVMTPNKVEWDRLTKAGIDYRRIDATMVLKGTKGLDNMVSSRIDSSLERHSLPADKVVDWIFYSRSDGRSNPRTSPDYEPLYCEEPGSLRRAGGQGDVLTGCIATFIAWNNGRGNTCADSDAADAQQPSEKEVRAKTIAQCAHAGCTVTRMAARRAFEKHHRAMGAPDLIDQLGGIIQHLEHIHDHDISSS